MLRYSFVLVAGLWVAGSAGASTWADGLFSELSKDFGHVSRGPTLKHHFRVVNNTKSTVTASGVRVSCGCVSATLLASVLKPGESTTLEARMDTTRFTGPKTVTIFVTFSEPEFREVRLWVQANGRNDFVLSPDTFNLGQVKRGTTPAATTTLTFYGHPGAKITSVKGESNYVQPSYEEKGRQEFEVSYQLAVKMRSDTPVGRWFTDVWVTTDIPGLPKIRVPLAVDVESPLVVTPSLAAFGSVKTKADADRRLIVRGTGPFKITEIKGQTDGIEVRKSDDAKEIHVITVRIRPDKAGVIDRTLTVVTDMKEDNRIDFRVNAAVSD